MQEIIQFAVHHWLLTGVFIILLILLMLEEVRSKGLLGQISPQDLIHLINRESAVVVDIRNREVFQDGHIVGAVNFPQPELEKNWVALQKYKHLPVVVVCANGQKAGEVVTQFKKHSFERVHALAGGINAWKNAHLPLVKK